MSQENVEVVQRMYDAFHSGDADGALAHFDPNVVVDASRARPDGGRGRGREQLNAIVTAWMGTWDEWREEIAEMRDLGAGSSSSPCSMGGAREAGLKLRPPTRFCMTCTGGTSLA
jgi:ketosteroid isomerase-like protein